MFLDSSYIGVKVWAFSMDITLSDAPKYKQIMRILVSEMQERGMEPHARFYSESELKDRFQVSVPTIRMALKELIQEGLIYREHGKGTFISPPSVKDQVLIVGRFEESLPSREFGIVSFMQSLIGDGSTPPSGLMPVAINSRIFQQLAPDLKHSYPNAKGVLFFRDFNTVRSTYAHLEALDLPYIFYGSDSWKNGLGDRPTCFYSEATIIEIGLSHLKERYGERITFAYSPTTPVFKHRLNLYLDWMEKHGLEAEIFELPIGEKLYDISLHEEAYRLLQTGSKQSRSIFCVDDRFALLFHNAALRLGLRIPEDLAILGINDYPFCNMVYPAISSISIPLHEDGPRCLASLIDQAKPTQSPADSKVHLVIRQSA